jgi:hypothetical protein
MLTRGRAVQESVKEALSELQSVVLKLQVHLLPACSSLTSQHHGAGHKALEGRCSDRVGDSAQRCARPQVCSTRSISTRHALEF